MKGDPIDDERLASILEREEEASVGFADGTMADEQKVAVDAYYGRPYGDEEDGRSQFVTRDVAEVVDYMTVAVLRAFVSGDHVVEFEGHDKAKEITAAMHYLFLRKQNGYRLIHDWLKGGLLEKIGVIKTAVETEKKVETQQGQVGVMALAQMKDDGAEIVAAEQVGEDQDGPIFNVSVRKEVEKRTFPDYNVPVDEFRFATRTVSEETSTYLNHVSRKTRSALIEMGFDPEVVEGLPVDRSNGLDQRQNSRFASEGDDFMRAEAEPSMQEVLLREEYAFIDRDGDGIAERVKTHRVDKTILEATEVDDEPFVVFCPFPMPGVMVGQSLADKTMDIQRLRTVTTRVTLDGFYLGIAPRTLLPEEGITENTIDDLLTVRPGGVIRYKGAFPPQPYQHSFDPSSGLAMLEFANGERESRTGITRMNQGLDRDALNKTATGTALMQQQGAQIEEYIARNFGECLARLFSKKLKLLVEFGEPFAINIDGKQVTVDPKQWPTDLDMNVQVGLGTGRKDQRLAYRQLIVSLQAQAKEGGIGIVSPKQFFNSASGIVADTNLGSTDQYFTDPDSPEGQQLAQQGDDKPDPAMMKIQADQKQAEAQQQLDGQKAAAELQQAGAANAAKLDQQHQQAELQQQLARDKAAQEADLAERKFQFEAGLAQRKMELEAEMARENAARQHEIAMSKNDGISQNRPGGDLDK